jgi:hypothetical protein
VDVFGDHYDAVEKIFTKVDASTTQQDSGALKSVYKAAVVPGAALSGKDTTAKAPKVPKGEAKSTVMSGKKKSSAKKRRK